MNAGLAVFLTAVAILGFGMGVVGLVDTFRR